MRSPLRCLVLLFSALWGVACTTPPVPSVIVACDPTGLSAEDVCNRELLARVAERWSAQAAATPGVSLRGLMVGKDYSSTQVWKPLTVPLVFDGDVFAGVPAWQAAVVGEFTGMPVEHDQPETRRVVRSDLVSLVTLASVQARQEPGAVVLLLATDGRLVSAGVNAEREIPVAATVLSRIKASGVALELSVFTSVVVCGVHHVGLGAGEHTALQELWHELITAHGGPSPTILPSCVGVESMLFATPVVQPTPAEVVTPQESDQ